MLSKKIKSFLERKSMHKFIKQQQFCILLFIIFLLNHQVYADNYDYACHIEFCASNGYNTGVNYHEPNAVSNSFGNNSSNDYGKNYFPTSNSSTLGPFRPK